MAAVTCATCAHWGEGDDDRYQRDRAGMKTCRAVKQHEEVTAPVREMRTSWAAMEAEEQRLLAEAKALVVDGSGYYAALRTRETFGCVLHEKAPGA